MEEVIFADHVYVMDKKHCHAGNAAEIFFSGRYA